MQSYTSNAQLDGGPGDGCATKAATRTPGANRHAFPAMPPARRLDMAGQSTAGARKLCWHVWPQTLVERPSTIITSCTVCLRAPGPRATRHSSVTKCGPHLGKGAVLCDSRFQVAHTSRHADVNYPSASQAAYTCICFFRPRGCWGRRRRQGAKAFLGRRVVFRKPLVEPAS